MFLFSFNTCILFLIKKKKKKNLLINEDEGENNDDEEVVMEPQGDGGLLEFTSDEVTYKDRNLPNLVVRHSMLTLKASKSNWWRNNIFKTRCSSHGRLCNVIIDGGLGGGAGRVVRILFLKNWR